MSGTLNSVNTNTGAMIALESLNKTNSSLAAVQKQISTGYAVADATDNGAAYAVAQRVRSDIAGLTSANQQLGGVQGLLQTTISGLNNASNTMTQMRSVLVSLANGNTTGSQRSQYVAQYQSLVANVKTFIQDAGYNGKTLIGNITGSNGKSGAVNVVRNESGATYNIASTSGSAMLASVNFTSTQLNSSTSVQALITATGTFINATNTVGSALNTYGSATTYVNNQITYNSDKINSLNSGLGSLVDANMAAESAQLTSLQIRQQLGVQALSVANQAPSVLLKLFP